MASGDGERRGARENRALIQAESAFVAKALTHAERKECKRNEKSEPKNNYAAEASP